MAQPKPRVRVPKKADKGDVVEITAEGDDEETAVAELVAFIERLGS